MLWYDPTPHQTFIWDTRNTWLRIFGVSNVSTGPLWIFRDSGHLKTPGTPRRPQKSSYGIKFDDGLISIMAQKKPGMEPVV